MIATVLLLLAVLEGSPTYGPPALPASQAALGWFEPVDNSLFDLK